MECCFLKLDYNKSNFLKKKKNLYNLPIKKNRKRKEKTSKVLAKCQVPRMNDKQNLVKKIKTKAIWDSGSEKREKNKNPIRKSHPKTHLEKSIVTKLI